jgi:hypothetical protein
MGVRVDGLHPESEWYLCNKISTLMVSEIHLSYASTQLSVLPVLETEQKLQ